MRSCESGLLAGTGSRTISCGCGSSSARSRSARDGSGTCLAAAALIGLTALLSLRSSETWLITLAGVVPMFCLFELTNYFYAIMALFAVWAYREPTACCGSPHARTREHGRVPAPAVAGTRVRRELVRWFWVCWSISSSTFCWRSAPRRHHHLARSTGPSRRSQSARQLPPFPGV